MTVRTYGFAHKSLRSYVPATTVCLPFALVGLSVTNNFNIWDSMIMGHDDTE